MIFQRGFDPQIDYDDTQVERLRAAMQRQPGILLWSHRSNLDTLVLAAAMQEKGLPPAHLFAGINMAFGPMALQVRNRLSPSFHSLVFLSRYRGVDATRNFATGCPAGVNRSSGSSTRFPAIVIWVSPAAISFSLPEFSSSRHSGAGH